MVRRTRGNPMTYQLWRAITLVLHEQRALAGGRREMESHLQQELLGPITDERGLVKLSFRQAQRGSAQVQNATFQIQRATTHSAPSQNNENYGSTSRTPANQNYGDILLC